MKKAHSISWQIATLLLFGLLIVVLAVINFALGVFHMATSTGLPSPMVIFVSKQFNVSINYPQTWAAFELTQGSHGDHEVIAFFGYAAAQTTVNIAQRSFSQPTLDRVAQWGESRLAARKSQRVTIDLGAITNQNSTAILRQYSITSETPLGRFTDKCMDWYTIADSTGYALSFCTPENHWPEMENVFLQMARSFKTQ